MGNKHKDDDSLEAHWSTSQLYGGNAAYLEVLYDQYLQDPNSLDATWKRYFDGLPRVNGTVTDLSHAAIRDEIRIRTRQRRDVARAPAPGSAEAEYQTKQLRVLQIINAYRFRGHLRAKTNPLNDEVPQFSPLPRGNLTEADLDTVFHAGTLASLERATLREILQVLEQVYCGSIGAEYMYIMDSAEKAWIRERLERVQGAPEFDAATKQRLLGRLTAAEGLERYLHTKYVGQKRFSLEGAESLIPMLDELIQRAGIQGVKEVVIGMAHRGRLNVLINTMGKTAANLFLEFEGKVKLNGNASGDVKYHQGFSSNIVTPGGPIHVVLSFNPSHLEIVGPVVEGSVRARQDRRQDQQGDEVVPVIIHGDAAFAGQGVVMETFNMSQSRGYATKGTIHIVINNQIGFTTSNQQDARSTLYCTDVAKMVNAPIFHVNGDDPEAVAFVIQLALDFRMKFRKDVVIDLVSYRRQGHNEADEPWATQPQMYKKIASLPTTRAIYAAKLQQEGIVDATAAEQMMRDYRQRLDAGECVVEEIAKDANYPFAEEWAAYPKNHGTAPSVETRVSKKLLVDLTQRMCTLPEGFKLHPTVAKVYKNRLAMAAGEMPLDWGFAETMAYATLVHEGYPVRLSGQDSGRGTFFHRHAVVHDQNTGRAYVPLRNLSAEQANFLVINSLLSEEAVLAFEYGYASTDPKTLTIWEAQFGDFANTAQTVIDQFISAGEQKWERLCGLVLLLPHGYEGQGPEHSSARLERYLQLCAEHNMQVCVPSNAAQIFHLLRRQMLRTYRKPLIIMSPKSLLRHKLASSAIEELTEGAFQPIIPECDPLNDEGVKRVVMCSGKVFYDLLDKRRQDQRDDVAIIRMEQLYPFPTEEMRAQLDRYKNATNFIWCQEEPKNQGSWFTSQHHARSILGRERYLEYAGRPFSAAPATGYGHKHAAEQKQLVEEALGPKPKQNVKG